MKSGVIALLFSSIALAVGVYSLTSAPAASPARPPRATRAGVDGRVAALEAQVARLAREVESMKTGDLTVNGRDGSESPVSRSATRDADARDPGFPSGLAAEDEGALAAIVDAAVDRKAKQVMDEMRVKENKKPAMDVLASVLELTDAQRADAERVIVDGQREAYGILETPTRDGANLMDELVEIAARGIAEPGKDHGFGRWFARVLSERIPGTDETYGARIESVKNSVRSAFKREWSPSQYKEFEQWGVDPIEVEEIDGSPQAALIERILERARTLGADLPDNK